MTDKEIESLYELLCSDHVNVQLALTMIEGSDNTFEDVLWRMWEMFNVEGNICSERVLVFGDSYRICYDKISNNPLPWSGEYKRYNYFYGWYNFKSTTQFKWITRQLLECFVTNKAYDK